MLYMRHFSSRITNSKISLFQIPVNLGQPLLGPDRAPALLLENGLQKSLESNGWDVKLLPVIRSTLSNKEPFPPSSNLPIARNCNEVGNVCELAFQAIGKEALTKNFILTLGGDHCIPIGTIPAIKNARKSLGVVWVDAHADINTPEVSNSGNMHGMPLSFLLGLVKNANQYPSMQWFKPCLAPRDIVYIGLRDLDNAEKRIIQELGIKAFTVSRAGGGAVCVWVCLSALA